MNSIEKLMSCLDDCKHDFKEGNYLKLCELMLELKSEIDGKNRNIRRYKKQLFQKDMVASCLIDHVTDMEYDSGNDSDLELYLRFQPGH